ncbi:MAG TPA: LysR family transcriptional regulator [Acidobacteriaceae bacterium]|nr:LysR family transcriptional regulator [Acidobacteriaceae bacterium]
MISRQQLTAASRSVRTPSIAGLQAFESVARHGSVTLAAQDLNLTQSAVSRQISQLESLLDISLFERVRQRLVITDAGRLYLNDVRSVLDRLQEATSRIMACGGDSSYLNLAVLPTFATRWLMPRLHRFLQNRPGVIVNFATRLAPFDFHQEPFDAGIHYGLPSWPGAVCHHLLDEETVPVCSPRFRSTHRLRKIDDLSRVTLLHQTTRTDAWMKWFGDAGIRNGHPLRGPRFEQFNMIAQAVVCDLGVALLPRILIHEELSGGKMVELFNRPMRSNNSYYLVVPDSRASSGLITAFTQWIVSEARESYASA